MSSLQPQNINKKNKKRNVFEGLALEPWCLCEGQRKTCRVDSLLPCGIWELNSGHQAAIIMNHLPHPNTLFLRQAVAM